jgi:uncharacterized protein
MIVDFTVSNFRSFAEEQTLSLVAEGNLLRHRMNYTLTEGDKLAILRTAVVLGANASGKSNLLIALEALRWIVGRSGDRRDGDTIPPYEPNKLLADGMEKPVKIELEFIVPSGVRYQYKLAFNQDRILVEELYAFPNRQRALIFARTEDDTWETIKFGGTYKGGSRRIAFFGNQSYLAKAGNEASAPESIREVANYITDIRVVGLNSRIRSTKYFDRRANLEAVSRLLSLVDTGISNVTAEENKSINDLKFPDEMPESVREAFIDANRLSFSFWSNNSRGEPVEFDEGEISDGTLKLFDLLPTFMDALSKGFPVLIDEMDGNLHTLMVDFVLDLFNDPETNPLGAQLIFTTHDTNVLNSNRLRRDQIWFVEKQMRGSKLIALEEFDKSLVRPDSPFESFYTSGRLGGLPKIDFSQARRTVREAISGSIKPELLRRTASTSAAGTSH